eukprot:Skav217015  [mRNA]  locus=scaffold1803:241329:244217:- [translate_table: standard]
MDPAAVEEFRKLEQEKNRLEAEIKTLYEYLTEDGMPGVSGPLVDDEGFPRGDIDLYAVRQARNKYVCAQTDHIEATIDEVSQASPAEAAGLRVGDQICRFGSVSIQDLPREVPLDIA